MLLYLIYDYVYEHSPFVAICVSINDRLRQWREGVTFFFSFICIKLSSGILLYCLLFVLCIEKEGTCYFLV